MPGLHQPTAMTYKIKQQQQQSKGAKAIMCHASHLKHTSPLSCTVSRDPYSTTHAVDH